MVALVVTAGLTRLMFFGHKYLRSNMYDLMKGAQFEDFILEVSSGFVS